jgi:hypothetical protein
MSLFCACLSRRRNSQAHIMFQEQFARLRAAYPGTSYICLLDGSTGELMCVAVALASRVQGLMGKRLRVF